MLDENTTIPTVYRIGIDPEFVLLDGVPNILRLQQLKRLSDNWFFVVLTGGKGVEAGSIVVDSLVAQGTKAVLGKNVVATWDGDKWEKLVWSLDVVCAPNFTRKFLFSAKNELTDPEELIVLMEVIEATGAPLDAVTFREITRNYQKL